MRVGNRKQLLSIQMRDLIDNINYVTTIYWV